MKKDRTWLVFIITTFLGASFGSTTGYIIEEFVLRSVTKNTLFIDLQSVVVKVNDGKEAGKALNSEKKKKQALLNGLQQDLKERQEQFKSVYAKLTKKQRTVAEESLQKATANVQKHFRSLQQELGRLEFGLTKQIGDKASKIAAAIAEEKGATLVLNSTGKSVVYHIGEDITAEVIRRYDDKGQE